MNINRVHTPSQIQPQQVQQRAGVPPAERPFVEDLAQKASAASLSDEHEAVLTQPEKEFFEHLYPASAEAVRSYTPYHRDGQREAVRLGTLVDRKG